MVKRTGTNCLRCPRSGVLWLPKLPHGCSCCLWMSKEGQSLGFDEGSIVFLYREIRFSFISRKSSKFEISKWTDAVNRKPL